MKKSRYSDSEIMNFLKEAEKGIPVAQICRTHGISKATFYSWRSKYGGMDVAMKAAHQTHGVSIKLACTTPL